jgi:hypothetical protein
METKQRIDTTIEEYDSKKKNTVKKKIEIAKIHLLFLEGLRFHKIIGSFDEKA